MPTYASVLADARCLPVEDRLQLIEELSDSVSENELPALSSDWMDEIQRRSAEFESGSVQTVPWDVVRDEAVRRLKATVSNAAR